MNLAGMNKAIVAIIGGVLALLEALGVLQIGQQEHLLETISAVLTPLLVWLIPNK